MTSPTSADSRLGLKRGTGFQPVSCAENPGPQTRAPMEKFFSQSTSRHRSPIRGFTLLEILIVIGIVVIVVALVITALSRAQVAARKTRAAGDLQAIATALEQYKSDHGDYPRVTATPGMISDPERPEPPTGAQILCRALIAPAPETELAPPANRHSKQDGMTGPGFRVRRAAGPDSTLNTVDDIVQGRVYGPYLAADQFKVGDPDDPTNPNPLKMSILDQQGKPILYFPARPGRPDINAAGGYISPGGNSLYDSNDAVDVTLTPPAGGRHAFWRIGEADNSNAIQRMSAMLGDYSNYGQIDPGETAAHTGPFILWSAGEDGQYGPQSQSPTPTKAEVRACDDVINFPG